MKKTVLSVVIAQTIAASAGVYAADANTSALGSFLDNAKKFGGHVGTSIEFEDKKTNDYGGAKSREKTTTKEVFSTFYKNTNWDFTALYSLKLKHRTKRNKADGSGKKPYFENEDGTVQLVSLNKGFKLPHGFATGAIYELEYTSTEVTSPFVTDLKKKKQEHSLRPYLTYFNNDYGWGFYSNLEYLQNKDDKSAWGVKKEKGYSILFKPYKRIGQWELGVEFYHQVKDNRGFSDSGKPGEISDFKETYIEPIVQYSFEDAGTAYLRARFGKNQTIHSAKSDQANAKYFKDIRKVKVGYEQAVGDNWLVKAEYELAKDKETRKKADGTKEKKTVDQGTAFVQALYRF